MRFCLVNLGCKVNRVESDDAAALLLSEGWQAVSVDDADMIIVNTCTVTGEAEKKTRKAVHRALSSSSAEKVLVTGCAAAISPEVFEDMSPRVRVIPKAELMATLRDCVEDSFGREISGSGDGGEGDWTNEPDGIGGAAVQDGEKFDSLSNDIGRYRLLRTGAGFNTRVGVKIQDGCAHACTYCIVHVARGFPWSKPADSVRGEVRAYARAGVGEIVLAGINLGSYHYGSTDFADLLRLLADDIAEENAKRTFGQGMRVRLSSIEPMDVSDELIALLAASDGTICRHLHLPVQSGSTKVLAEMGRPYSAEGYLSLVRRLREEIPGVSLSTDIIAGFPGESPADFLASKTLCSEAGFSKMHVFPYSQREGTPAAMRTDQVASEIKSQRARELRSLGEALRCRDLASRVGTVERALVESNSVATTESYFEVDPPVGAAANTFVEYCFPPIAPVEYGPSMVQ